MKFKIVLGLILILSWNKLFSQDVLYADNFVKFLSNNEYEKAYKCTDSVFKNKITEEKFQNIWNGVLAVNGDLKEYSFNCALNNFEYYTCVFKNSIVDLKIILSNTNQVKSFFLVPIFECENKIEKQNFLENKIEIQSDTFTISASLIEANSDIKVICIFIQGSGPSDRDETIGPNKPIKDLAYGLGKKGISSIRFDKRTFTYKNLDSNITIKDEVIEDVLAVIDFIKENNNYNNYKLYLIGHSLGGMLAPKIATISHKVDGIIYLAANSRPLEKLIETQTKYIFNYDNHLSNEETIYLKSLDNKLGYLNDSLKLSSPTHKLPLGIPASYWLSLINYNQVEVASQLDIPMLFLQGKRDYQVTNYDFCGWKKRLGKKKNVSFKRYKNLNHIFLEGKTKSHPNEYLISKKVPSYVINDISKWILKKI